MWYYHISRTIRTACLSGPSEYAIMGKKIWQLPYPLRQVVKKQKELNFFDNWVIVEVIFHAEWEENAVSASQIWSFSFFIIVVKYCIEKAKISLVLFDFEKLEWTFFTIFWHFADTAAQRACPGFFWTGVAQVGHWLMQGCHADKSGTF